MERFAKKETPTSVTNAGLYVYLSLDRYRKVSKQAALVTGLLDEILASLTGVADGKRIQEVNASDGEAVIFADKYDASLFAVAWKKKSDVIYI